MSDYAEVEATVVRISAKAVCLMIEDRQLWVPMSVIHEDNLADIAEGVIDNFGIAEWFAKREEIV